MTIDTNEFLTFSAKGLREDLSDIIYNVSPTDTPGMSSFETTTATGTLHQWQTEAIRAAAANRQLQGDVPTNTAVTATVQLTNYTQIQSQAVSVSGTQQAVSKAGRDDEMEHQIINIGLALKTDQEYTLWLNQAKAVGNSTLGPCMATLGSWVGTNDVFGGGSGASPTTLDGAATRTNGTSRSLAESYVQSVITLIYNSGGNPDRLFCRPEHKQLISSTFTGYATHMVDRADATLSTAIDFYDGNFGKFEIVPDRFISDYGTSQYPMFLLETNKWAVANLRPMFFKSFGARGDFDSGMVLVEWTLEARNEKASGGIFDLALT